MSKSKHPTKLSDMPCSAFDRWVAAASSVVVNIPEHIWFCSDENPPVLIDMGLLTLSVRYEIGRGKIYEARLEDDESGNWQNMLPDENNTGESACPDKAVIKCIRATLRQLTEDKKEYRQNGEGKKFIGYVQSALRKTLKLMLNTECRVPV